MQASNLTWLSGMRKNYSNDMTAIEAFAFHLLFLLYFWWLCKLQYFIFVIHTA